MSFLGCSINDEILGILSPALVRVKMVHLGRNPITYQGWQTFKNAYLDAASIHEAALTHFSLRATHKGGSSGSSSKEGKDKSKSGGGGSSPATAAVGVGGKMLLRAPGAEILSSLLPLMEEVDLAGQTEVGPDGWNAVCNGMKLADAKGEVRISLLQYL